MVKNAQDGTKLLLQVSPQPLRVETVVETCGAKEGGCGIGNRGEMRGW